LSDSGVIPFGNFVGAPDLDAIVEDGERDGVAGDAVVAIDERVDHDLAHRIGRDERGSTLRSLIVIPSILGSRWSTR
jgi:hypothetical protein